MVNRAEVKFLVGLSAMMMILAAHWKVLSAHSHNSSPHGTIDLVYLELISIVIVTIVIDIFIMVLLRIEGSSDVGIFSGKDGEGSDEPTISESSLDHIVGRRTTVNELGSLLLRDLVWS